MSHKIRPVHLFIILKQSKLHEQSQLKSPSQAACNLLRGHLKQNTLGSAISWTTVAKPGCCCRHRRRCLWHVTAEPSPRSLRYKSNTRHREGVRAAHVYTAEGDLCKQLMCSQAPFSCVWSFSLGNANFSQSPSTLCVGGKWFIMTQRELRLKLFCCEIHHDLVFSRTRLWSTSCGTNRVFEEKLKVFLVHSVWVNNYKTKWKITKAVLGPLSSQNYGFI